MIIFIKNDDASVWKNISAENNKSYILCEIISEIKNTKSKTQDQFLVY